LAQHQSGTASRYTRTRRPVTLALEIPVADRSAALREEARIKRLPRAAKLALIAGAH
jgi:putative endonuclease